MNKILNWSQTISDIFALLIFLHANILPMFRKAYVNTNVNNMAASISDILVLVLSVHSCKAGV